MDLEGTKFGKGPKELGGSVDLVNYYKLQTLHDHFCKRSLPSSISETKYLHNVVGDTKIKKGQGMELDQLFQENVEDKQGRFHPFDLGILREAFQLRETNSFDLSYKNRKKEEKKRKKRRDKDAEYHKDGKRHKQRGRNTKKN